MSTGSSSVNYWGRWVIMAQSESSEKIHPCHSLGRNRTGHVTNRAGVTWLSGFLSGHKASLTLRLSIVDSSLKSVF